MKQKQIIKGGKTYLVKQVGVGQERIFIDNEDYLRFVLALEFYTRDRAVNLWQMFFKKKKEKKSFFIADTDDIMMKSEYRIRRDLKRERLREGKEGSPRIITVLGFSLLPRSFYLLVKPVVETGMQRFMQKMCGYVKYFNKKHHRRGCLFRANYERIDVDNRKKALKAINYIHSRPLQLWIKQSEKRGKNPFKERALTRLSNYKYSSYMDYIGIKNFPSVTNRGFLYDHLRGRCKYQDSFGSYIIDKGFFKEDIA